MNDQNDPGQRKLRDVIGLAPDGRRLHHWRGKDRQVDIATLADAIAATGELFNHNETLVQLDGNGKLINVNLAALRELVCKRICGVRVVVSNGVGRKEFYSYEFAPTVRPGPPRWEDRRQQPGPTTGPDDKALMQIYKDELLWRIPRAEG
jgi:hypothetical protein